MGVLKQIVGYTIVIAALVGFAEFAARHDHGWSWSWSWIDIVFAVVLVVVGVVLALILIAEHSGKE